MMKFIIGLVCLFCSATAFSQNATIEECLQNVSASIKSSQPIQAVILFKKSIDVNIDRSEMYYWIEVDKNTFWANLFAKELAIAYKKKCLYDKAYLFYRELLLTDPNDLNNITSCAEMEVLRGHENEALKLYEKILSQNPDHLKANIYVGNYYYLQGEREKQRLEQDYKKLTSPTRMQYARFRDTFNQIFLSKYVKAREALQRVIRQFPSTEIKKTLDSIVVTEKEANQ